MLGGKYHTCLSYQSVIKSNWPSCTTWLESLGWHYAVLTHFFPALSPRSEVGCYFNSESSHMPGPTWTDDVLDPAQHLSHLQQDRFHTHRPGTPDSAAHFSGPNSITQLLEWPEDSSLGTLEELKNWDPSSWAGLAATQVSPAKLKSILDLHPQVLWVLSLCNGMGKVAMNSKVEWLEVY